MSQSQFGYWRKRPNVTVQDAYIRFTEERWGKVHTRKKWLEDIGINCRVTKARKSKSRYLYIDSMGIKVRFSDHLNGAGSADSDFEYPGRHSLEEIFASIQKERSHFK